MNLAAYQIMAEVFERLDIHSGTVFNYHQERRQTKKLFGRSGTLQYDLLYGEQYVYERQRLSDHRRAYGNGRQRYVDHGDRGSSWTERTVYMERTFTKQSKIYINDEKQRQYFPE